MFYTLASRIPLISGDIISKRFFKIFLFGSIAYILLHYYLYSEKRFEVLDKLKSYLYYVMALDLGMAYYLTKWSTPQIDEDKKQTDNLYTHEQRAEIDRNLRELKNMQENNNIKEDNKSQTSPFISRNEIEENDKKNKTTESTVSKKTESSSSESEVQKKKSNKQEKIDTDTQIPVYMGN